MMRSIRVSEKTWWMAGALFVALAIAAGSLLAGKAAPLPPREVVNHATRQCAMIVAGDECGDAILPAGWEYLDEAAGQECPAGYEVMHDLQMEWAHFKVPFCCTEGHSGSRGDCQDVVIRKRAGQCAFVDDLQSCAGLPKGWEAWSQDCPAKFEWVEEVACSGAEAAETASPATLQPAEATSALPGDAPAQSTPAAEKPNSFLPCCSSGLALLVLAAASFLRSNH